MYAWGVLLSPALGAALMAASTVIVAINARLLRISRGSDTTAAMPEDKQGGDSQQQIAKRAYELYEQHGHQDGHPEQDWLQAEREIKKTGLKNDRPPCAGHWFKTRSDSRCRNPNFPPQPDALNVRLQRCRIGTFDPKWPFNAKTHRLAKVPAQGRAVERQYCHSLIVH